MIAHLLTELGADPSYVIGGALYHAHSIRSDRHQVQPDPAGHTQEPETSQPQKTGGRLGTEHRGRGLRLLHAVSDGGTGEIERLVAARRATLHVLNFQ
jgi:hypothetical protein